MSKSKKTIEAPTHLLLTYHVQKPDDRGPGWLDRVAAEERPQQTVVRVIDVTVIRPTVKEGFTRVDVRDHDRGGVHKYIVATPFAELVEMLGPAIRT